MRVPDYFSFRQKPRGLWRWLLRLPVALYRLRLGFVLGDRALVLVHRGRRSGRRLQTPLEVVRYDGEYIVSSGTGPRADWYLNLKANPAEEIWVGNGRYRVEQRFLPDDEAAAVLAQFAEEHPREAAWLGPMTGVSHDGSTESALAAVRKIPMVGFTPRRSRGRGGA